MKMMKMEVAQAGMASVIHSSTAMTKIAITRCWTTFRPSMPKHVVGSHHITKVMSMVITNNRAFFLSKTPERKFCSGSDII